MTRPCINVLVTGATGFLGKAILRAFTARDDVRLIAACRRPAELPAGFNGEVRSGDLRDAGYRRHLLAAVDVICHAGTWAAMWDHRQLEHDNFYQPTRSLIDTAMAAGVKRFIMASTVVIAQRTRPLAVFDDFSRTQKTGFWPHLDYLIDIDRYMQAHANQGMQMITLRLGHFVGAGNRLGLVPVLAPRLRTRLVPWLSGGKSRLPLIADADLGHSFVCATLAKGLRDYESFNICGGEFPATREVIEYIAEKIGVPAPWFSVPYSAGYLFARLMELLHPVLPGRAPFLTRSVVHLAEEWVCDTQHARQKLGYQAQLDWRSAIDAALDEMKANDYPWAAMTQPIS